MKNKILEVLGKYDLVGLPNNNEDDLAKEIFNAIVVPIQEITQSLRDFNDEIMKSNSEFKALSACAKHISRVEKIIKDNQL